MQISLENLEAGNVVVLRDGTQHVIESVIFTCPVQLLIAESHEKYLTVYLKFAEDPFDVSHLYGLNGNFSITEDPRDIVDFYKRKSVSLAEVYEKTSCLIHSESRQTFSIQQYDEGDGLLDLEYDDGSHYKSLPLTKLVTINPNGNLLIDDDEFIPYQLTPIKF